ncbi:MAG: imidazoleglycerol-phosphate dehydratase HisB [Candidatus Aureabacteria bacterium]|nr:imidazoleglycerol-phosphate dehydratase HisB [Candidatus Auribacterota bacterium]MCK5160873.1 imidazoleglycerol-phosphate dehydratase HisB [Candidatus Auribacterota bacterium]
MARSAVVKRKTKETDIRVKINIDGEGKGRISTGVGFLDHMLELFSKHSLIDIEIKAEGDVHIDDHHVVEDVGIALGEAFKKAFANKKGIVRYSSARVPMDESLVEASLDVSGRAYLAYKIKTRRIKLGSFNVGLVKEFMRAFVQNAQITLHLILISGEDVHHIYEAAFKALAKVFREALKVDERVKGTPSTKGKL